MPLYEYKCGSCGLRFEELSGVTASETAPCKNCGQNAQRQISRFSSKVVNGSTNESVDMTIGRAANDRWQRIHDRREQRIAGRGGEMSEVKLPQSSDGKFMPVMALGDRSEREKKKEYVSALQDHRKKRSAKGQSQFGGPGLF